MRTVQISVQLPDIVESLDALEGLIDAKGQQIKQQLFEHEVGHLKFGVDDIDRVSFPLREYAVLLDSIADDQLCYVLYLPPLYLVKMTDKKWR